MPTSTFRIVTLDVWGNARDGYEINNQYRSGAPEVTFRYKDSISDAQLIRGLRRAGVIDTGIRAKSIEVDDQWPDFVLRDVRQPRIPAKGDAPSWGWGKPVLILENVNPEE